MFESQNLGKKIKYVKGNINTIENLEPFSKVFGDYCIRNEKVTKENFDFYIILENNKIFKKNPTKKNKLDYDVEKNYVVKIIILKCNDYFEIVLGKFNNQKEANLSFEQWYSDITIYSVKRNLEKIIAFI